QFCVGGYERQSQQLCRGGNKSICRVGIGQSKLLRSQGDFMREWSFPKGSSRFGNPLAEITLQADFALSIERQCLPRADRRQPYLVCRLLLDKKHLLPQLIRVLQAPQPDVGIERESQSRNASQSSSSVAAETMSRTSAILAGIET